MPPPTSTWRVLLRVGLVVAILTSCQSPPPAPIAERVQPPSEKISHHWVSMGDTLYSIAWRYELDFVKLAAANDLPPPYRLYPGQRLSLDLSQVPRPAARPQMAPRTGVVNPPPEIAPAAPPSKAAPEVREMKPAQPPPMVGDWRWQWPLKGRVAKEYDASNTLKGISIYAQQGAPVAAAAPGVVVYAGSGLRGYGQLIIVKHSDQHLSAYAHNRKLLVGENDPVKSGQTIAEVGADNANGHRLYFEIRENGKPVDPLDLLPRS